MKIALIQYAAGHDVEENRDRGTEALKEAADNDAKLVIYPELCFTPFFPQHPPKGRPLPEGETIPGPTTEAFGRLAKEFGVVIVLNLYERDGGKHFDSSPLIDAGGEVAAVARMVHIMQGEHYHEQDYYDPGDHGAVVCDTAAGRIGVAICYDRHYPEYMRALAVQGAQLVAVPQAGEAGEWTPGLYEAELQVASMQNGYFTALANRVGKEEKLEFAGQSFVCDPSGLVIARAPKCENAILYAEIDYGLLESCPAQRHFLKDRRPDIYPLA